MAPKKVQPAKPRKTRATSKVVPSKSASEIAKEYRETAISYLNLRRFIGYLAIGLPFIVSIGGWLLFRQGLQGSISAYYYTEMRNVFVGALWAIGLFLCSYRGLEQKDTYAGIFAGVCAIGISLFPTTPDGPATSQQQLFGIFHFTFATLFFVMLIIFSVFIFTQTNKKIPMTPQKKIRNRIYIVCGIIMFVCIIIGGSTFSFPPISTLPFTLTYHPVFWLEALADLAFGYSWIIKGGAFFAD